MKKTLSVALAFIMLITAFSAVPFIAKADIKEKYIKGVNYEYSVSDGKVTIEYAYVSGNSAGKTITIPSKIGGKKVVALESVRMEEKNTKTTTLVIPDSIVKIGGKELSGDYKTISLTNLKTVKIGKGLKTMSYNPFTVSVTKFEVNSKNKYFSAANGILYNKKKTKLVAYPASKSGKTFTVPKSVKTIGANAFFYAKNIVTLNTNKVKKIQKEAFTYSKIKTVKLGAAAKSVTGQSFGIPDNLKEITVPGKNKYFSVKDSVLFNKKKTKLVYYPIKKKGTSYKVPSSVTTIGKYAFLFNGYLKKITLPSSVTAVESYAFYICFANINLPSKLKSAGAYSFAFSGVKTLNFPSSFTTMGKYAFTDCTKLTSVDLSKAALTNIPEGAFSSATALTSLKLSSKTLYIGYCAFSDAAFPSVSIPASVKTVADAAFYSSNLKTYIVNGMDTEVEGSIKDDAEVYDWDTDTYYPNPIVIKAPVGSKAQAYAAERSLNFEAL